MGTEANSNCKERAIVAGVILAGGLARRMGGGDKSLLALGNRTILDSVVERLSGQIPLIALNANGDSARFASHSLPVIPDTFPGRCGPLAGVLAGMEWACRVGASHVATVAADTPYFPLDLVKRLARASEIEGHPIAMAASSSGERGRSLHPTFGYWSVDLREDLRASLTQGIRKVVQWTDIHGAAVAEFDSGEFDPFFNINTPEDLELARRRVKAVERLCANSSAPAGVQADSGPEIELLP